jgi:hypothetical protein
VWIDDRIKQLHADFLARGRAINAAREPGVSDATIARKTGELYANYQEQKDALLARRDMMVAKALMEDDDAQETYHS